MEVTISETERRRKIQNQYNIDHNIVPKTIEKGIRDVIATTIASENNESYDVDDEFTNDEIEAMIEGLKVRMYKEAEGLNFEAAAEIRDKIEELRKKMID